jgi:hypothetical protein
VFDAKGSFERTIGSGGQGPGELQDPQHMAVAGDRLVVNDRRNARLSVWDLDGNHVGD